MAAEDTSNNCTFRAIGFCGVDDSINPRLLALISHSYPLVEWGILFRPDKEGEPRYASPRFVDELSRLQWQSHGRMKLAAHLCSTRVNEVLNGRVDFVARLQQQGFRRIQVNATQVNGVDTSQLAASVPAFLQVCSKFPALEFILQRNEETSPLWEGVVQAGVPKNVTMLVDESKGTGVAPTASWPTPPQTHDIGYAGGIGPSIIRNVIQEIQQVATGRSIWIDMESSLRTMKNGKDVFDIDACYSVIDQACKLGVMEHPEFLK